MSVSEFTHLHVHSQYSLLDGAIRLKDLFPRTRELGMQAVALTDHGNMFGTVDFYKKAKAHGIKPILGCETYICNDRHDRQSRRNYHLILLARNNQGYANLRYLNSMGFLEGFYYHPRIDKKLLKEHSAGLFGLSACLGGEIAEALIKNGFEAAKQTALEYRDLFEPGAFHLEVQPNGLDDQEKVNESWKRLSRETGIPLIATGDCHYVHQTDAKAHEVLMAIQQGRTLTDDKRLKHSVDSYYLKSPAEFNAAFYDMPEALENSVKIARACDVELTLGKSMLPRYRWMPEGYDIPRFFRKVAEEGLESRFAEFRALSKRIDEDQYRAQLQREIEVIIKMDFPGYFLIVWDFINHAKSQGIPVGPGRGSGAGSLVAYSLRITDLDPIPYNLLFERFLNPERISMPDFDIDFCMNRRDEVIRYVAEKYGKHQVGQIITFGSLSAKSALKDVGRVMGLPFQDLNDLTKNLPNLVEGHPVTMQWAIENEPKFKQAMEEKPEYQQVIRIATALEGLHRNAGMHAAGIVISEQPLWDYVPCYRGQNGEIVTQFAKEEVEEAGLVKFDFLGLKTLTVIDQAVRMLKTQVPDFDLRRIPMDDARVYAMISEGDTTGVFQLESSGFKELLKKLRPDCFEDIIAAGALYRPGPLEGGMVDDFINRKHGRTPIVYHHPAMEPILRETYGVIVYQEQVMQIARALAGYSLGGADLLRRAMGKKKKEVMEKEKAKFLQGARTTGVDEKIADEVFELMAAFAGYGFNKSHSAAYGLLTYQTAFLKYHYPEEFMAALLTCDKDDTDKVVKNVSESRARGIPVLRPDINESGPDFTVVPMPADADPKSKGPRKAIRFGLSGIKGVGETAVEALIEVRDKSGPYKSLCSLCEQADLRRVNKKVLEALIKSGALDAIVPSRVQAMDLLDQAVDRAQKAQKERESGQTSLFGLLAGAGGGGGGGSSLGPEPPYRKLEEWPPQERLKFEKESLGFYISGHPVERYTPDLIRVKALRTDELQEKPLDERGDRTELSVGGIVSDYRERPLKSGTGRMAFFKLEDLVGSIEVVCFSRVFNEYETVLKSDKPILCVGTLAVEGEGETAARRLHLKAAHLLQQVRTEKTRMVVAELSADETTRERLVALRELLKRHHGGVQMALRLRKPGRWRAEAQLPAHFRVLPSDELIQSLENLLGAQAVQLL